MPTLHPDHPLIPPHEFALLWPALSSDEQDALTADIDQQGLRVPILLYDDPLDGIRYVLDGIHRYASTRALAIPCEYTLFEGDRLAALAVSSSLNALRRHLDTRQRAEVAARELVAQQSVAPPDPVEPVADDAPVATAPPRPTVQQVADSVGVSKRTLQRELSKERQRVGVPSPPGGHRKRATPPFLRDKPDPSPLDDVVRLVRRLKGIPPPGQQQPDDANAAGAITMFVVSRLERSLYGRLVGESDVLAIDRPAVERAHAAALELAESLPLAARRRYAVKRCSATNCRGDGTMPEPMGDVFRRFCDRCIY